MNEKSLEILEYPKVLERVAQLCAFSASAALARAWRPVADLETARRLQEETAEASRYLEAHPGATIGGARDVREAVESAARNAVLTPGDLLDVKATLIAARVLARTFERLEDAFPRLAEIASRLPPPPGLVDAISRSISERGEVLDSASEKLAQIRSELRSVHDRLLSRLERMANNPKYTIYLQENLVTQRDGRYVLPLRAEFKGRIKGIVHDQSASGATLFVEPLGVVELNNNYREMQLAERDEVRRILAELSRRVGEHREAIHWIVENLAVLDLALARARYAASLSAVQPDLKPLGEQPLQASGAVHPASTIRIWQARHPLLDPLTVVPIDVELDPETYALVITGPNTGGKTVTLKTVGLMVLMAQSGLHIPAQAGSQLSVFEGVYADIGDEQSIEQSLSTFSGHITNIVQILGQADRRSLVLLDELGAGTDPQEGAALAQAILQHLLDRGVTALVATHFPGLKSFAHAMSGVVNASVEFDLETLSPTYHLTIGLPGRSNALAIAERLGLPQDIVESARTGIDPAELQVEDLLDEIHRQRELAVQARVEIDKVRSEVEALRSQLAERLERIEDERRQVLAEARAEAATRLGELENELRELRRALALARQPLEALQAVEAQITELKEEVDEPVERLASELPRLRAVRLGDRVQLRSLNTQGVVSALGEEEAEVRVGNLRVRARLADLDHVEGEAEGTVEQQTSAKEEGAVRTPSQPQEGGESVGLPEPASPGVELHLRGQRVDEALDTLDRYLDSAYLAGLPFVRIIHGKGTGRLRDAVRQYLKEHPHVKSVDPGRKGEGGDGVTVAQLENG